MFNLNKKLKHYSSIFKHTNKANLRIIDILTHQAKLFPWIPFYEQTLNEQGEFIDLVYESKFSLKFFFPLK